MGRVLERRDPADDDFPTASRHGSPPITLGATEKHQGEFVLGGDRPRVYMIYVRARKRVPRPHLKVASGQDVPRPPPNKPDLDSLGRRPQNAREGRNNLACVRGENRGAPGVLTHYHAHRGGVGWWGTLQREIFSNSRERKVRGHTRSRSVWHT